MRYSKVLRYSPLVLVVGAALVYLGLFVLNLVYNPLAAGANTAPTGTYNFYEIGGDDIWNWDFLSESAEDDNVDWSMRFVFGDNAEIDKVKDHLAGC